MSAPICRTRCDVHLEADPPPELRVTQDYIDRLEAWCDQFGDPLPNLKSFILPGGTACCGATARGAYGGAPRRARGLGGRPGVRHRARRRWRSGRAASTR